MRRVLLAMVFVFLTGAVAMAQDPTKVAAKEYKTEVDNAQVRVLHIHYGPHEIGHAFASKLGGGFSDGWPCEVHIGRWEIRGKHVQGWRGALDSCSYTFGRESFR
jgi:hypothetical protein